MERYKKIIVLFLLLAPIVIAFKNFLDFSNPLVWGDAPYFFKENLNELFNFPFAWESRNSNFGSPQLLTLWLYIPTFLMGLLYKLFNLPHELSIRLVFYLPFLIFGFSGIWLILGKFKLSTISKLLGCLFYLLNTYSILLLDGGQIGVLVSYGLFPFCLYLFLNYSEKNSLTNLLINTFFHFLIFNSDLRVGLMLVLIESIWGIFLISGNKFKLFSKLFYIYVLVLILSGFWLVPFLSGLRSDADSGGFSTSIGFIKLTNSFYLFQPHFPQNDFGNLNKTPVYFIFISFIIFLVFLKKEISRKEIYLGGLFLVFIFLAKGNNPPIGEVYTFLINRIPLASAFRDSSKFYIPALLIGCILISLSVEFLKRSSIKFNFAWIGLIYASLLFSIYPVFINGVTGVLGNSPERSDYDSIRNLIKEDSKPFRTLWFKERPSMGFSNWNNPSINANLLFQERPFASMIDGEYDLFGFLHNENISTWYELLGIKYIFYPPYEREKSLTIKEKQERVLFENFVSKIPNLEKINLPISFPIYKTQSPASKIFAQEKILFIVGGEQIYQKLFSFQNFNLKDNSTVFLESCKFDPVVIFSINPKTFALVITDDKNDLYLSFFCKNLIPTSISEIKEWAINSPSQYLNWKAQLLERGIRNYDYDYNLGLAYSTKKDEKIQFELDSKFGGDYYLPIRVLTSTESAGIKVNFANNEQILKSTNPNKLEWKVLGPMNLEKGSNEITLTNMGGLAALNTLGLIPSGEFESKKKEIDKALDNMLVIDPASNPSLNNSFGSQAPNIDYKMVNPAKYEIRLSPSALSSWLVFSERFNKDWELFSNLEPKSPLPFYSMINGYYIYDLKPNEPLELRYKPQEKVLIGLWVSGVGLLLVGFLLILNIIKRWRS